MANQIRRGSGYFSNAVALQSSGIPTFRTITLECLHMLLPCYIYIAARTYVGMQKTVLCIIRRVCNIAVIHNHSISRMFDGQLIVILY